MSVFCSAFIDLCYRYFQRYLSDFTGPLGKYQIRQFLLLCMVSLNAGIHMLSLITVAAVPKHRWVPSFKTLWPKCCCKKKEKIYRSPNLALFYKKKKKGIIPGSLPLLRYLAKKTGKMLIMSFCEAWTLTAESWIPRNECFKSRKTLRFWCEKLRFSGLGVQNLPKFLTEKNCVWYFRIFLGEKKTKKQQQKKLVQMVFGLHSN